MSDSISHSSCNTAKDLNELGDDYLRLIGADRQIGETFAEHKHCRWTGVVSTEHFVVAGCVENMLEDDLVDAWQEIESIQRDGAEPWEFLFNAKDHELPDSANDIDDFRLSVDELEDLGRQVTRLREQVSQRTAACLSIGDAADVSPIPPKPNM